MSKITASSVAIICPTKNQSKKISRLLSCIENLNTKPGQVIIADAEHYLSQLISKYETEIQLMYINCPKAGQVLQRNF